MKPVQESLPLMLIEVEFGQYQEKKQKKLGVPWNIHHNNNKSILRHFILNYHSLVFN